MPLNWDSYEMKQTYPVVEKLTNASFSYLLIQFNFLLITI